MINTTVAPFVLETGSQKEFNLCSIICEPTYLEDTDKFTVRLRIQDSVAVVDVDYGSIEVTATEVDAETGAGTGETDPWFNALQKAVITKLAVYNVSTTFTIV